jgi:hypothetical protein
LPQSQVLIDILFDAMGLDQRILNQFGAIGRGRIAGQSVTGAMTIYLPPGG